MENHILRQIRFLKLYAAAMTLAFGALCLTALSSSPAKQKFGEIDAQRINIVDDQGNRQLVISNQSRFPEPKINGQELKGGRSIKPAGIVFYDTKGNETGGFVTSQTGSSRVSVVAFDHETGEVLDLGIESDNDKCTASLRFVDPPPPATKLEDAAAKQQTRITLQNKNKDASITLADGDGKERIKLGVAPNGEAKIQILDAEGKAVFSVPQ